MYFLFGREQSHGMKKTEGKLGDYILIKIFKKINYKRHIK